MSDRFQYNSNPSEEQIGILRDFLLGLGYRLGKTPDLTVLEPIEAMKTQTECIYLGTGGAGFDSIYEDERFTPLWSSSSYPTRIKNFREEIIDVFCQVWGHDPDEIRELVQLAKKHDKP